MQSMKLFKELDQQPLVQKKTSEMTWEDKINSKRLESSKLAHDDDESRVVQNRINSTYYESVLL